MSKIEYAAATYTGNTRENNEDSFFADGNAGHDDAAVAGTTQASGLFAVFDGMGGAEFGEFASMAALRVMSKQKKKLTNGDTFEKQSRVFIDKVNTVICAEMKRRGGVRIGAAAALLLVSDGGFQVCNIGDCRVYMFDGEELMQISVDHTRVRLLLEAGILTPENARTHPERHILTQHLGVFPEELIIEPFISERFSIRGGESILLCSDGLTDAVEDEDIMKVLRQNLPAAQVATALMNAALENGGSDNITVVVLRY
jgi:protein phosphatase